MPIALALKRIDQLALARGWSSPDMGQDAPVSGMLAIPSSSAAAG